MTTSTITELSLPEEFNIVAYDNICKISASFQESHPLQRNSFASSWNAFRYRTRSMIESNIAFTNSIKTSNSPTFEERFKQEDALFLFFASSVSVLECFSFSLYCLFSIYRPDIFPINDNKDLRFYPKDVLSKLLKEFPNLPLTIEMENCFSGSNNYTELNNMRNFLSHRGMLQRNLFIGGPKSGKAMVANNPLEISSKWDATHEMNENTTSINNEWVLKSLWTLLDKTNEFAQRYLINDMEVV